jgi:hypothetical protein
MQMEVMHGQTVPGVLKALTVFALVYNLVRMVMCPSAILQHLAVERIHQLSGGPALVQRAMHWPTMSGVDRESRTPPSRGAARHETAAEAFPLDDQVSAGTASAMGTTSDQRLTSCHSRKTLNVGRTPTPESINVS